MRGGGAVCQDGHESRARLWRRCPPITEVPRDACFEPFNPSPSEEDSESYVPYSPTLTRSESIHLRNRPDGLLRKAYYRGTVPEASTLRPSFLATPRGAWPQQAKSMRIISAHNGSNQTIQVYQVPVPVPVRAWLPYRYRARP